MAFAHQDDFTRFLIHAKQQTYASQGDDATVTPLLPGSRQLEYQADQYLYRDIYFGVAYFVGQETVYYQKQPLWAMSYAGGVTSTITSKQDIANIYAFLRSALQFVPPEHPYRGPTTYTKDTYAYTNMVHGDVARFSGHETITRDGFCIYELHYSGGLLLFLL